MRAFGVEGLGINGLEFSDFGLRVVGFGEGKGLFSLRVFGRIRSRNLYKIKSIGA